MIVGAISICPPFFFHDPTGLLVGFFDEEWNASLELKGSNGRRDIRSFAHLTVFIDESTIVIAIKNDEGLAPRGPVVSTRRSSS